MVLMGITANAKFSASAGVNIGVDPSDIYEGNLVPLSGGVAYEDNPTITYLPVQGKTHIRGLMAPIRVDFILNNLIFLYSEPYMLMRFGQRRKV